MTAEITLVALGGNALWPEGGGGAPSDQIAGARRACAPLLGRLRDGGRLLIVFGNGPQVGAELVRGEAAAAELVAPPLDVCVASTQGTMGYFLSLALRAELTAAGIDAPVTALLSLAVVDPADPAFEEPTKPIGPAGRAARLLVPSPRPIELPDAAAVRALLDAGHVVIAGGGGGIPVVRRADGALEGIEAVIDKDRTAALLARELGADLLINLTGVSEVRRGFGTGDERPLPRLTVAEARRLLAAGEFPAGSMGPKIESAVEFVAATGNRVLITDIDTLPAALAGDGGTVIVPAEEG
jgi:carbamate kinase